MMLQMLHFIVRTHTQIHMAVVLDAHMYACVCYKAARDMIATYSTDEKGVEMVLSHLF